MPDGVAAAGHDWLTVIRRRGWIIAQVAVVVTLASYLASRLQPATYETYSALALYSAKERTAGGLDISEGPPQISPEIQVQLIKSRDVLSEVLDTIGMGKTPGSFRALRAAINPRVTESSESATMVSVYVEHSTPQTAADIANETADKFVKKMQDEATESTEAALKHVDDLLKTTDRKLQQAEDRVERFKETGSPLATTDDAGAGSRIGNYSSVEVELAGTRVEITTTQAELDRVRQKLKEVPERREETTTIRNPLGEALRTQIMELEQERSALLAEYTEQSDEVKLLDRRLQDLRRALAEEEDQVTDQIVERANETYESFKQQQISLETKLSSLQARQRALESLLARRQDEVRTLPEDQTEMARMLREERVQEQLYTLMLQRKAELEIEQMRQPVVAEVIEQAPVPTIPAKPNRKLYAAIGLVAGILLGLIVAGLVDQLDDTFGDASEVERYLEQPVLGTLPLTSADALPVPLVTAPTSPFSESVRAAAAAIQAAWGDSAPGLLVVTGPLGGEGKSTVAANLAAAFGETGRNVILVDADLRFPVLHEFFRCERDGGLAEALGGSREVNELLKDIARPGVRLLTAGAEHPNPGALLGAEAAKAVWEQLRQSAALVVLDTPATIGLPDASIIARSAEATLLVIDRASKRHAAAEAATTLTRAGTTVVGVIRNGERMPRAAEP